MRRITSDSVLDHIATCYLFHHAAHGRACSNCLSESRYGILHETGGTVISQETLTDYIRRTMPDATVTMTDRTGTMDHLKVVVVCRPGEELDPEKLFTFLVDRMPRFMLPRYRRGRSSVRGPRGSRPSSSRVSSHSSTS